MILHLGGFSTAAVRLRREQRLPLAERELRYGRRGPRPDRERRETARYAGVARSTVGRIVDQSELYREFDPSGTSAPLESATGD